MAFSGHRPERLPWGNDESDPRCAALKEQMRAAVRSAAEKGVTVFLCGMARGCDFYFAEAVADLTRESRSLRLEAYLPCPSQADRWPAQDRRRRDTLLRQCTAVHMVEQVYTEGCMLRRNRAMVDRCDILLTVWDGGSGGTAAAIRYARRTGKTVMGLWL